MAMETLDIEGVGTLTLCDDVDLYMTTIDWGGEKAELYIRLADEASLAQAGRYAKAILEDQEVWDEAARECAAHWCVDLANDWAYEAGIADGLEDDEIEDITEADFIDRIKIENVTPKPDGSIEFYYTDGGLFEGHSILVHANMESDATEALMV